MINQHRPQRFRIKDGRRIGTVPIGTIIRSSTFPMPFGHRSLFLGRGPFIVTAWLNREYTKFVTGKAFTVYIPGGHLATVKSLADGREYRLADHYILAADDAGDTVC